MENRFLRDRAMHRGSYRDDYNRSREDYYRDENYMRDSRRGYDRNNSDYGRGFHTTRADYYESDMSSIKGKYREELEHLAEKLRRKSKFSITMDEVIEKAKQIGMRFDEVSELEFYVAFLMMVTDYPMIGNDVNTFIQMARAFFMDDDIMVSPCEKLCIYYYNIVKGEE